MSKQISHSKARKAMKEYSPRKNGDITYALKRTAMQYVYEAKRLLGKDFQRVNVIIGEATDQSYVGVALTGQRSILIPANTFSLTSEQIKFTVWHEICHALGHSGHNEDCPLMCSRLPRKMDWKAIETAFIKNVKETSK